MPNKPDKFNPGQRVRWYIYSADMIVINGGAGTVINKQPLSFVDFSVGIYEILVDGGQIELFPEADLDLLEWEDNLEDN